MNTTKTLWTIDPYHSDIDFKVKHLVISTVTGSFKSFNATVETDGDDLEGAEIHFEAETDSITTGVKQRDEHLRSDDFFNAEKFPKLTFESTSFTRKGDNEYELKGNLTIRDITKPVTLNVVHGGTIVDQNGDTKAGFEVSGKINRKDFGLKWNGVTETGNVIVSDEVKMNLSVQFAQS
jgi:polyisoprenoid-binding protein YceI